MAPASSSKHQKSNEQKKLLELAYKIVESLKDPSNLISLAEIADLVNPDS